MSFMNLPNKTKPALPRGQLGLWIHAGLMPGTGSRVLSQADGKGRISNMILGADQKAQPRDPVKVSC